MDLNGARVWRERDSIDLLIEVPGGKSDGLVIAFEIKIDAVERENQLSDYALRLRQRYPEGKWKHVWCFLTPDGRDGSTDKGTDDNTCFKSDWRSLSFDVLVTAIQAALDRSGLQGEAIGLFEHYVTMMKRHDILTDAANAELENAVQTIWAKHKEALDYLIQHRPNPLNDVLIEMDLRGGPISEISSEFVNMPLVPDATMARYRRFSFLGMKDGCPALFEGDQKWISSGAQVVFQIWPEKDEIVASFVVGPEGDNVSFRNALIECMNAKAPKQLKPIKSARHYWRTSLLKWDDLLDTDDKLNALDQKIKGYLSEHCHTVVEAIEWVRQNPSSE